MTPKSVFVFELNEFNDELLTSFAQSGKFPGLARLVGLEKTQTYTEDTYESDFLEPWVQWVSVHSGTPSQVHKIKHLGDVPTLDKKQFWEVASDAGISSGVWGVLNGSKGASPNCKFFLPDPWTFSESGYPGELNSLLNLPRYMAKNRTRFSVFSLLKYSFQAISLLLRPSFIFEILRNLPLLFSHMLRNPKEAYVYFCFVEYFSSLLCLEYMKKYKTSLNVLFVNGVAHVQHYYWEEKNPLENHRLAYSFYFMDRLATKVFESLDKDTKFLCLNAMSQKNTNDEKTTIFYRPTKHEDLWQLLGVTPNRIEPLMSYDCLVFFDDEATATLAKNKLLSVKIRNQPLFLVENYPENPKKLFYRLCFFDELSAEDKFVIETKEYMFFEYFTKIIKRTGRHIPYGVVYSNLENAPTRIANHKVYNLVLDALDSVAIPTHQSTIELF